MKNLSELFSMFKTFYNEIKIQFGIFVQTLLEIIFLICFLNCVAYHGILYLTSCVIGPNISFAVTLVSHFLNSPCVDHLNSFIHMLKYIKRSPEKSLIYGHNNHIKVVYNSDTD